MSGQVSRGSAGEYQADETGQNTKAGIPSLADLPDPGIKPGSPALQADSL